MSDNGIQSHLHALSGKITEIKCLESRARIGQTRIHCHQETDRNRSKKQRKVTLECDHDPGMHGETQKAHREKEPECLDANLNHNQRRAKNRSARMMPLKTRVDLQRAVGTVEELISDKLKAH